MSTEFTESTPATETGSDSEFTASEANDTVKAKKSSNKVIIVVALLACVAVVAFYGMRILNSPAPQQAAPPPEPSLEQLGAAEQPVDPLAAQEDPLAALGADPASQELLVPASPIDNGDPLSAVGPTPSADPMAPAGLDPLAAPPVDPVSPVDVMSQDPLAPVQVQPVQPAAPMPGVPAPSAIDGQVQPAQPMDPALAALAGSQPAPVQPVSPSPVVPSPVQPVVPAPGAPEPALFDGGSLAAVVGQAVTDALRPMEKRWNERFDGLERRISRIEASPRAASVSQAPRAATPAKPKPRAKPAAPAPASKPVNRIEVLGEVPAPVATSPRPTVSVRSETPSAAAGCSLGAVLEGRAWVKRGDGSFETYIVGDTLPDGKTITAITPERGIVVGKESWSCK